MDRTNAVTLLALIFLVCSASAQTTGTTIRKPSSTRASSGKTILSPRWTLGYGMWQEKIKLARQDGLTFPMASSVRAMSVGYQLDWLQRRRGWAIEGQLHFGGAASESRDEENLAYFQKDAPMTGAAASVMHHWNFERPRMYMGIGLASMLRQIKYETPVGYSFGRYQTMNLNSVRMDFSFPVAARTEIIQQFGIPLDEHGSFWSVGVRWM